MDYVLGALLVAALVWGIVAEARRASACVDRDSAAKALALAQADGVALKRDLDVARSSATTAAATAAQVLADTKARAVADADRLAQEVRRLEAELDRVASASTAAAGALARDELSAAAPPAAPVPDMPAAAPARTVG